jgi:glucose-1-phosphate adenylyltransferase
MDLYKRIRTDTASQGCEKKRGNAMPLDVQAVILGGGRGTRLYPLTKLRTKPAVPIGGKYRLIDITISNCINAGITRIFVLTQYLSASLHRHVHQTYQFDVFSGGTVEILPAEQTLTGTNWYQGTADAVRQQMPRILSRSPTDVLILAGDHLYRMDYHKYLDAHRESGADVTLSVLPVSAEQAGRFGILKTDEENWVVDFFEKPQAADDLKRLVSRPGHERPYMASMGIYFFKIEVLQRLLDEIPENDFGRDIIPAAIRQGKVLAYPFEGYWEDIGTIGSFYEANLALTQENPPFDFYDPQHPIYTHSRFLPSSRIDGCRIERAVVADGCRVYDAEVENCVLGLRSVVRPGAKLRNVVMMGADFYETQEQMADNREQDKPHVGIGRNTSIERAIIDKNARIGHDVVIGSHEGDADHHRELYSVRDGIVVIPKNTVIPHGTVI